LDKELCHPGAGMDDVAIVLDDPLGGTDPLDLITAYQELSYLFMLPQPDPALHGAVHGAGEAGVTHLPDRREPKGTPFRMGEGGFHGARVAGEISSMRIR
jgi:hypothetical protein